MTIEYWSDRKIRAILGPILFYAAPRRLHKLRGRSRAVIKKSTSPRFARLAIRMQRHGKYSHATPGEYSPKLEVVKGRKVLAAALDDPWNSARIAVQTGRVTRIRLIIFVFLYHNVTLLLSASTSRRWNSSVSLARVLTRLTKMSMRHTRDTVSKANVSHLAYARKYIFTRLIFPALLRSNIFSELHK